MGGLHLVHQRDHPALVVGVPRHLGSDDQLVLSLHRHLRVVALLKTLRRGLHDPAFRIREVVLRLLVRLPVFPLVGPPALRVALRTGLASPRLVRLPLPGLQTRPGRPDRRQPVLPAPQLLGQLVAPKRLPKARILGRVGLPRPRQQRFDLARQTPLLLPHPTVTHRLALAGIGSNLRPVNRQLAEVRNAGLARQTDHLHKQRLEIRQMTAAKLAYRPMARIIPRRQHPKRHVLLQLPRQPPGRKHPRRVPVDQRLRHHHRLIRRLATTVPLVRRVKRRQVQSVHQIAHMVRQVPLRQPIS